HAGGSRVTREGSGRAGGPGLSRGHGSIELGARLDPHVGRGPTVGVVHDDLLSIGALARACGPSISALRFYDAAGVLRPAHVDPVTGYRWYTSAQVHTARLIANLRR